MKTMTDRERFNECMHLRPVDRVPTLNQIQWSGDYYGSHPSTPKGLPVFTPSPKPPETNSPNPQTPNPQCRDLLTKLLQKCLS